MRLRTEFTPTSPLLIILDEFSHLVPKPQPAKSGADLQKRLGFASGSLRMPGLARCCPWREVGTVWV